MAVAAAAAVDTMSQWIISVAATASIRNMMVWADVNSLTFFDFFNNYFLSFFLSFYNL